MRQGPSLKRALSYLPPVFEDEANKPKINAKVTFGTPEKRTSRQQAGYYRPKGGFVKRHLHHTVFAALAALVLLPCATFGQQQDQDQSSSGQTQTDNQGKQRQWRRGAFERQRQHMAMLAEKLNLTDTQKEQFQKINQETRKQAMAIRQDSSLSNDQKKEKMQALRKQQHQQMFGVLTQEQKDKLKELREEHMKEQNKDKPSGDQASAKKPGASASDDDDPFAGMTSDDDDGPSNGGLL
jgi:Spy/CpxP family protein refolding chaperone